MGGAVTAVWVRDAAGILTARQFRLFYATFAGSAWSVPLAVDPTSNATDAEPSAAYRSDGTAVVSWMRDGDRSLATLNDRQIAQRSLTLSSPVVVETSLPAGAAEPSLAIIGDQRQLHAAKRTCGG